MLQTLMTNYLLKAEGGQVRTFSPNTTLTLAEECRHCGALGKGKFHVSCLLFVRFYFNAFPEHKILKSCLKAFLRPNVIPRPACDRPHGAHCIPPRVTVAGLQLQMSLQRDPPGCADGIAKRGDSPTWTENAVTSRHLCTRLD